MTDGRAQSHVTRFLYFAPSHIFGIGEAKHFKFRVLVDTQEYLCTHDIKGCVMCHVASLILENKW